MTELDRQKDESIMIGDDLEIIVVDIRGDRVYLGIIAPMTVPVHRREIYDAIQREDKNDKKEPEEKRHEEEKNDKRGIK